jgi:hypothetical protein
MKKDAENGNLVASAALMADAIWSLIACKRGGRWLRNVPANNLGLLSFSSSSRFKLLMVLARLPPSRMTGANPLSRESTTSTSPKLPSGRYSNPSASPLSLNTVSPKIPSVYSTFTTRPALHMPSSTQNESPLPTLPIYPPPPASSHTPLRLTISFLCPSLPSTLKQQTHNPPPCLQNSLTLPSAVTPIAAGSSLTVSAPLSIFRSPICTTLRSRMSTLKTLFLKSIM